MTSSHSGLLFLGHPVYSVIITMLVNCTPWKLTRVSANRNY